MSNEILKVGAYSFFTKAIVAAVGVFTGILVTRFVGPEGQGILAVIKAYFPLVCSIGSLSICSALVYYIPKCFSDKKEYVSTAIAGAMLASVVLVLLCLLLGGVAKKVFFKNISTEYYYIGLVFIPLIVTDTYSIAIVRGLKLFKAYNINLLLNNICYLGILCAAWAILGKITVGIALFSLYVSMLSAIGYSISKFYKLFTYSCIKKSVYSSLVKFGIKEHIGVISQKLNLRLDILIMSAYLSIEQIGIYSVAVLFAELLWYVPDSIAVAMYPVIASIDKSLSTIRLTEKSTRINLAVILLGVAILLGIGKYLIVLLLGKVFTESFTILIFLLPGIVSLSITKILTKYYAGIGKPIVGSYSTILGCIVNVPLLFWLVPKIGIRGAAIATAITYTITAVYILCRFKLENREVQLGKTLLLQRSDVSEFLTFLTQKLKKYPLPNSQDTQD